MCSLSEDVIENGTSQLPSSEIINSGICRKCRISKSDVVLRGKDPYCSTCFHVYFVHKFRSTIGKSKEIKHKDNILIGFSGGLCSTSLLHLIKEGLNEDVSKRLRFEPSILFIDESALSSSNPSVEANWSRAVSFGFPFYYTHLEEVMKPDNSEVLICRIENENIPMTGNLTSREAPHRKKLETLLSRMKSSTSKQDMIRQLKSELIARCASQLGFRKVFLGTCGTELAVQILADIALGRGSQLGVQVPFKGSAFGVEVFRPMRELFEDEIQFYTTSRDIVVPDERKLSDLNDSSSGIVPCTRDFINELQKEFLSTVPTIFKTGGKLVNASDDSTRSEISSIPSVPSACEDEHLCAMCGLVKEDVAGNVSAIEATRVSKKLSEKPKYSIDDLGSRKSSEIVSNSGEEKSIGQMKDDEMHQFLCFGCGKLYQELGDMELLTPRVKERLKARRLKEQALDLIQDHLL